MSLSLWPSHELEVRQADLEDVFADIVRVAHQHRPFSHAGELIVVRCNGRRLVAAARGSHKNEQGVIYIDMRGREKLGVSAGDVAEFTFESADFLDEVVWAWNASNPMSRFAARLAVLGLVLGLIGLALGLISIA